MSHFISLFVAFSFLLLHACSARHTIGFESYNKDVKKDEQHEMNISVFSVIQAKETEEQAGSKITSMAALRLGENAGVGEVQSLKRKQPRSMLQNASHDTNKESAGVKEDEPIEDVVVTDYVQPHRKAPIHNHH